MADLLLFLASITLIMLVGRFSEEIAQCLWKPKVPSREWTKQTEYLVKKCRLASTFGGSVTLDHDASGALASLLERMAGELDRRS